MKQLFIFVISFIIFIGCSSSNIELTPTAIKLQNDNFSTLLHGTISFQDYKKLSRITIEQKIFKDEYAQDLVYEEARVLGNYQFRSSFSTIFSRIFDAKKVKQIRNVQGLGFYTIELKNTQTLYLISKTTSKKHLHFLYGFSKENFQNLLDKKALQKALSPSSIRPIQTQWNEKLLLTGRLLESKGGPIFRR